MRLHRNNFAPSRHRLSAQEAPLGSDQLRGGYGFVVYKPPRSVRMISFAQPSHGFANSSTKLLWRWRWNGHPGGYALRNTELLTIFHVTLIVHVYLPHAPSVQRWVRKPKRTHNLWILREKLGCDIRTDYDQMFVY